LLIPARMVRARLRGGDPDLTDDELQGTIEKVEAKRQALAACLPGAKHAARVSDAIAQGRRPASSYEIAALDPYLTIASGSFVDGY
jgi:hypothetical protein